MKQYIHLFDQRQIDIIKLGINNIDKSAIIIDAISNNTINLIDSTSLRADQIVLDWDVTTAEQIINDKKMHVAFIINDKDDDVMIKFIDKMNEQDVNGSPKEFATISQIFTSYDVSYCLNFLVNNTEYRSYD